MKSLQARVFLLVAATFSTIYLTQPVLPVLGREFGIGAAKASLSVSAVIFGIALATLPLGRLADRFPERPILLAGGTVVSLCGFLCAATESFPLLVAARFLQGLAVPAITTCLVVFLARRLPPDRLNVAMGSYVSATVAGGLGGRLLAGFIHPPLHWRYAFVTASVLLLLATLDASRWLPRGEEAPEAGEEEAGFAALLSRGDLLRIFFAGAFACGAFLAVFNYLPFRLTGAPFHLPTHLVTLLYLSYLVGVAIGPSAGRMGNRFGNGKTMAIGSAVFAASMLPLLAPSIIGIAVGAGGRLRGLFRRPLRGGRGPEPEAPFEPRQGKLPVYPFLLSWRLVGDHRGRHRVSPGGVERGGRPRRLLPGRAVRRGAPGGAGRAAGRKKRAT